MFERKLRILMLAPTPYFTDCGSHVRIYEEAKALTRLGHNVRIVTYSLGRDLPGVENVRIRQTPKSEKISVGPSWQKSYLDLLMLFKAKKLARAYRPHLIHAHMHSGAKIGGRLKKRLGIPLLFDYHGSMTGEMIDNGFVREGSLLHRFFLREERRINNGSADFIITRSAPMARDLVDRWGVPRNLVASLKDGVDTNMFRLYSTDEVRTKLRLPNNVPLVVYLGMLNRNKGIDTLLSTIVQLKSKGSPIRFLIMGYPEEEYRSRAADLGIERMIIFSGKVDYTKAPFFLSAGDIAVSPTCYPLEPNSKLLGYMACGLPTLAFDTPVNRELLGDAGVYAGYDDSSDLAEKLTWLMGNIDERRRLGQLVRERSVQMHSWDNRAKVLDEIYRTKLKR